MFLGVLQVQKYRCITCVADTCSTHGIHMQDIHLYYTVMYFYTCITRIGYTPVLQVKHVLQVFLFYNVLQLYELNV